jgi:hypothetical protein
VKSFQEVEIYGDRDSAETPFFSDIRIHFPNGRQHADILFQIVTDRKGKTAKPWCNYMPIAFFSLRPMLMTTTKNPPRYFAITRNFAAFWRYFNPLTRAARGRTCRYDSIPA